MKINKSFELIRFSHSEDCTLGVLFDGEISFCNTIERPWKENQRGISCIPEGHYYCERVQSPRFGNTFEVMAVPGRSKILFHKGNLAEDSHGCIILGEEFGELNGKSAVISSGRAFEKFLAALSKFNNFALTISSG